MKRSQSEYIVDKLLEDLENLRSKKALTHERLAALAGVHRSMISLLENKKRTPTILTCLKLCTALDVHLDDVLRNIRKAAL